MAFSFSSVVIRVLVSRSSFSRIKRFCPSSFGRPFSFDFSTWVSCLCSLVTVALYSKVFAASFVSTESDKIQLLDDCPEAAFFVFPACEGSHRREASFFSVIPERLEPFSDGLSSLGLRGREQIFVVFVK